MPSLLTLAGITTFMLGLWVSDNVFPLIAVTVTSFALTFIVLYYLRVALKEYSSLKSQLLQIELRKSLCQFVQSYAEFAESISKKAPESLAKFENVIFSNIVPNEDNVPSTFDGLGHIASLVKAVKSSS